jgi:hypothetical protein
MNCYLLPTEHEHAKESSDIYPWQEKDSDDGEGLHGGAISCGSDCHARGQKIVLLRNFAVELW